MRSRNLHIVTTLSREVESEAGEAWELRVRVAIGIKYTPGGPPGGHWNKQIGTWDPPDPELVEINSVEMKVGTKWCPASRAVEDWAEEWIYSDEGMMALLEEVNE